ncbi:nucleoid-associated protein [Chitinimonas sp.]|uniref:nucleoid-associated protein n=1 Tax=Chitinimonas sp. TaxID=1934313 RepID=UPI0035AF30A5
MNPDTTIQLIIHKLCKMPHGPASIELRQRDIAPSPLSNALVEQLADLYAARSSKGYGKFEEDEQAFPLPRLLRQHVVDGTLDFTALSQQMMEQLLSRVQSEALAGGGYVLFARQRHSAASDSLLVAIIAEAQGTALNGELEMVASPYLDLANLRVAGRIDLAAWQSDSGRYISFLKGRTEVADYFKLFLGCNDVVAALKETQKLIKGIAQFAEREQLAPDARNELFENAHRYLDDLGEHDLPWSVDTVVKELSPAAPEALRSALQDETLGLSDGCIPDRRAIRPLLRFKAAGPNWKLEFNRSSLRSGDVIYNRSNDTIVLFNVPDDLKRALSADQPE